MALKVRINGQMQQITGPGNKPVVFINGAKKKLVKGVAFINGEKRLLWGQTGIIVDVIDYSKISSFANWSITPVWTSNNYIWVNLQNSWYKVSVSNISNPSIEQRVSWGRYTSYSNFDSTQGSVFFTVSNDSVEGIGNKSHTYRKISIGSDGAGLVSESANYQTSNSETFDTGILTQLGWYGYSTTRVGATYYYYWLLNGERKGDAGRNYTSPVKYNENSMIFAGLKDLIVTSALTPGSTSPLYSATSNINSILIDDTNIVIETQNGIEKISSGGSVVWAVESPGARLLGKILNYYVIIDSGVVKILSDTTGAVEQEYEIPEIIYGTSSFYILPTVSQTGYLAFSYNKKIYRISLA